MNCLKRILKGIWKQIEHNWAIAIVGAILFWIITSGFTNGFTQVMENQIGLGKNQEQIYTQCKPFRT